MPCQQGELPGNGVEEENQGSGDDPFPYFLVTEILMSSLKDVKLLKTCRLVCQSWNIYACDALKKLTYTSVDENSSELEDISRTLHQRSFDPLVPLPSPFKNFHISCSSFTSEIFESLLNTPNITIPKFQITPGFHERLDVEKLRDFLEARKLEITSLNVRSSNKKPLPEIQLLRSRDALLPCCQNASIDDNCPRSCHCVRLINSLLVGSRLRILELDIKWQINFATLLEANNLSKLKMMTLWFSKPTNVMWNALQSAILPELEVLRVHCNIQVVQPDVVNQFNLFLENLSPTLADLSSNIASDLPAKIFPRLTKVSIICSMNKSSLARFAPHRFPSLRELAMNVPIADLDDWVAQSQPHYGVRTLRCTIIECTPLDYEFRRGQEPVESNFLPLLTSLYLKFPKITDFKICIDSCTTSNVMDIHQFFPTLRDLQINGPCHLSVLTAGTTFTSVANYLDKSMTQKKSILDFQDLESLTLGQAVIMKGKILKRRLVKLKKLKFLSFHWNLSLMMDDVENLFKGMDHVKEIRIHGAGNCDCVEEIFQNDPRIHVTY